MTEPAITLGIVTGLKELSIVKFRIKIHTFRYIEIRHQRNVTLLNYCWLIKHVNLNSFAKFYSHIAIIIMIVV